MNPVCDIGEYSLTRVTLSSARIVASLGKHNCGPFAHVRRLRIFS